VGCAGAASFDDSVLPPSAVAPLLAGKTVAIARDAAFCFLYPANVDTLHALGAQLRFFSPLADEPVPEGADAVYLPGGYPELHGAPGWRARRHGWHRSALRIGAVCRSWRNAAA
jgi:cobyrinic acid a,c-diamide synthase